MRNECPFRPSIVARPAEDVAIADEVEATPTPGKRWEQLYDLEFE